MPVVEGIGSAGCLSSVSSSRDRLRFAFKAVVQPVGPKVMSASVQCGLSNGVQGVEYRNPGCNYWVSRR